MKLMTLDEMIFYKKISGLSYMDIAERSGVPLSTVQKVFCRATSTPRNKTLLALGNAFEEFQSERLYLCDPAYEAEIKGKTYKKKDLEHYEGILSGGTNAIDLSSYENKSIDDYLALPNDVRVELIDGVFYDMAAPSYLHNQIAIQIWKALDDYIYKNNGKCSASIAPTDVQLDKDDKTMVQPDVLVTCDRDKITYARVVGAPDLIIEVLSESNWYHDVYRKKSKYESSGVREYWIVMPKQSKIIVYFFKKSSKPIEYTFNDIIPVNIWDGKCTIDFKVISERLDYLFKTASTD
ncbi:MAG: Uma2 family endonuclease [Lachnospiraceae bacterium]|nr:Uma2 family endonuclease [Lachnospiraceae bacterium]